MGKKTNRKINRRVNIDANQEASKTTKKTDKKDNTSELLQQRSDVQVSLDRVVETLEKRQKEYQNIRNLTETQDESINNEMDALESTKEDLERELRRINQLLKEPLSSD